MTPVVKAKRNRLRKVQCDDCGCILYGSAAALRLNGLPHCGCGGTFDVPNLADLEHVDPAEFERRLNAIHGHSDERDRGGTRNAVLRELGYEHAIVSPSKHGSAQCSSRGCKQLREPLQRFCRDHVDSEVPF